MPELKEMMIHVERIVRPLHATERRKLQMRRELLSHLQATFDEERAGGMEEAAAWDAARRRLGEPAELTRELRKSVPAIERILWWRRAGSPLLPQKASRRTLDLGVSGMKLWQVAVFMLSAQVFIYGGFVALAIGTARQSRDAMMLALAEHTWRAPVLALITTLLAGALILLGLPIAQAAAERRYERVVRLGAYAMGLIVASQVAQFLLFAAPGAPRPNYEGGALAGVALAAGMSWLGRFLRPGMRDLGEWLTLEIAE